MSVKKYGVLPARRCNAAGRQLAVAGHFVKKHSHAKFHKNPANCLVAYFRSPMIRTDGQTDEPVATQGVLFHVIKNASGVTFPFCISGALAGLPPQENKCYLLACGGRATGLPDYRAVRTTGRKVSGRGNRQKSSVNAEVKTVSCADSALGS